jgi:hypothetical protein
LKWVRLCVREPEMNDASAQASKHLQPVGINVHVMVRLLIE